MRDFGTVKVGSTGTDVIVLQAMLRMLMCFGNNNKILDVDGEFGQNTLQAVKEYQKRANACGKKIRTDGTFDSSCWHSLLGY